MRFASASVPEMAMRIAVSGMAGSGRTPGGDAQGSAEDGRADRDGRWAPARLKCHADPGCRCRRGPGPGQRRSAQPGPATPATGTATPSEAASRPRSQRPAFKRHPAHCPYSARGPGSRPAPPLPVVLPPPGRASRSMRRTAVCSAGRVAILRGTRARVSERGERAQPIIWPPGSVQTAWPWG